MFEVVARSDVLYDGCYVIAPNSGPHHLAPWLYKPEDHIPAGSGGGDSMIVDYEGRIVATA